MKTVTTHFGGKSPITDYKATVKSHTAPIIIESYMADDGEMMHILQNGNELSENNYMKHWGIPKGKIDLKAKGERIDPRQRI